VNIAGFPRDKIFYMSDFIPKPPPKTSEASAKAARIQALREKAAKANNNTGKAAHATASNSAKANTSSHKKTAFQRKAT